MGRESVLDRRGRDRCADEPFRGGVDRRYQLRLPRGLDGGSDRLRDGIVAAREAFAGAGLEPVSRLDSSPFAGLD
jgi:hypothetical protein